MEVNAQEFRESLKVGDKFFYTATHETLTVKHLIKEGKYLLYIVPVEKPTERIFAQLAHPSLEYLETA